MSPKSLSTLTEQTQVGVLPLEMVALVLLCLPVDCRLRAREVSRRWRSLLNEPRFWTVLDISPGSGVVARLTRALLFAAGERGRGHLRTLELTGADNLLEAEDLEQFVAENGQSLRSVTAPEWPLLEADLVTRLCRSAPLCTLHCRVDCAPAEALPLLRCEAPCALLHVVKLRVDHFLDEHAVREFAAALPSHRGKIKVLHVGDTPLLQIVAVAETLMSGIKEARVSNLTFIGCHLAPASLPGLARLLQAGCLERLVINNRQEALLGRKQGPYLTAFCNALRSSTLQALNLRSCRLWQDPAAAGELLVALVGHPTLRELSLHDSAGGVHNAQTFAGAQLASVITRSSAMQQLNLLWNNPRDPWNPAANRAIRKSRGKLELLERGWDETHGLWMRRGWDAHSDVIDLAHVLLEALPLVTHNSALQKLDLSGNNLGEDGLGCIFYVLPRSSTLKEFVYHMSYENEIFSREFARFIILPAVRLNTSLRKLDFGPYGETLPELAEAQAIVAARTQDE